MPKAIDWPLTRADVVGNTDDGIGRRVDDRHVVASAYLRDVHEKVATLFVGAGYLTSSSSQHSHILPLMCAAAGRPPRLASDGAAELQVVWIALG